MARNPWHPRLVPMFAYLIGLLLVGYARDWKLASYPVLYTAQCGVVLWLLWRYRKLLPELTLRFHWLAVAAAVALTAAWIGLGWWMAGEFGVRFDALRQGVLLGRIDYEALGVHPGRMASTQTHYFEQMGPGVREVSLGLRLLGMSLVVPLFEELFARSLMLRGLHSARKTAIGLVQMVADLPLVGDWLIHTNWGQRALRRPHMFTEQLIETPVGALSVFGVAASTFFFMVNHVPRDWPGAVACGVVWCGVVWWTNRGGRKKGLGPVVWSHGLVNALLWGYTIYSGDWQFM
jgi:membrane protease YdiL (CAAX protease family)